MNEKIIMELPVRLRQLLEKTHTTDTTRPTVSDLMLEILNLKGIINIDENDFLAFDGPNAIHGLECQVPATTEDRVAALFSAIRTHPRYLHHFNKLIIYLIFPVNPGPTMEEMEPVRMYMSSLNQTNLEIKWGLAEEESDVVRAIVLQQ